ncbi:MAG: hypothetical protein IJT03_06330 [Clostridia bacterium]|nr:hypothetical protein [Clostridia bacterium]
MAKKNKEPKVNTKPEKAENEFPSDPEVKEYKKGRLIKLIMIIAAILLAVILLFSLLIDSSDKNDYNISGSAYSVSSREKNIKRGNGLVAVTVPAKYLKGEASGNLTQEQRDAGFTVATLNDDGSVTYTINENDYKTVKRKAEDDAKAAVRNLSMLSPEAIRDVSFNSSLTKVDIKIDQSKYDSGSDRALLNESFAAVGYMQAIEGYSEAGITSVYILTDAATGKTISEINYPADAS